MSLMPASTAESDTNSRIRAVRDQARERGLAGAGRPPQDHRVRPAGLERPAQRRAGTEQVRLPDELVEGLRAQPVGQRPVGAVADRRSLAVASDHIDSGRRREAETDPAANLGFLVGCVNVSCVI